MIKLKEQQVKNENHIHEPIEDLIRIQKALFFYRDIYCTLDECGCIWQHYSWELSASWLFIPKKIHEIVEFIESADNFNKYEDWISYN